MATGNVSDSGIDGIKDKGLETFFRDRREFKGDFGGLFLPFYNNMEVI